MTKEEKELVLKDLYARLPYGVKVQYWHPKSGGAERRIGELVNVDLRLNCAQLLFRINEYYFEADSVDTSKPYLRPMYSMTEEEKKEFQACHCVYELHPDFQPMMCNLANELNMFDWLNSHHFDYRGLIEKGLALEAEEGMYKIE